MSTTICVVVGSYKISGTETCELLKFCKTGEDRVRGRTMLARGEADKASMNEAAFQKFWANRDKVPPEFWDRHYFAFPEASDEAGCVRAADHALWDWFNLRHSLDDDDWYDRGVLVRFVPVA